MSVALIAFGGNIPSTTRDVSQSLEAAAAMLGDLPGVAGLRRSRWFRTPAHPVGSGPDFINGVARVETTLAPAELLERMHAIEAALGRTRPARWAPRICDLDLLAMDDMVLPDAATVRDWMALDQGKAQSLVPPRLILPHPRMQERAFVLVPLADIAPDWRHPLTGLSVAEMLAALPEADRAAVVPLEPGGAS
ncbi:2-amino-4-hydroxy-6-hydroxymethyldihydropteridine diphosphokinase [Limibaculum sp. FT325]|uniref:2-amino-4-hydroxy-6- hydroxymethyldihydropteridine diphosphokinase n=1 Tax=Thermohalobaculum sediminis TaxID=2939436 RepID=UPI0020C05E2F|nr:2-amino-4-hydroxy-6-hydroxymethyldihydropteridine diphosphokinase [Limibaculum sediminis]MCL5777624.1 2-amino-4-hydroxy-6-hydroxymethyldihydropteridine diphosphokinase [Limibaculum sediminis]